MALWFKKPFADRKLDTDKVVNKLASAIEQISIIDRKTCRKTFVSRFTAKRMCEEYESIYKRILQNN